MKQVSFCIILVLISLPFFGIPQAKPNQNKTNQITTATIRDIRILNASEGMVIIYHFDGTGKYLVQYEIQSKTRNILLARSFTGDVGAVFAGGLKKAIWDYKKDGIFVNEEITVKVKAIPAPDINMGTHVAKSIMFPGWGDYKIREKKPYWIIGATAYGLAATSIGLNLQSIKTYDQYKSTVDPAMVDTYYQKSLSQRQWSFITAGLAGAIWLYDLVAVSNQTKRVKNGKAISSEIFYIQQKEPEKVIAASEFRHLNTVVSSQPPVLEMTQEPEFVDDGKDHILDAEENATIAVAYRNRGKGTAFGVYPKINLVSGTGFKFTPIEAADIKPNEIKEFKIKIQSDAFTRDGNADLEITPEEALGFSGKTINFQFPVRHKLIPVLNIDEYEFVSESENLWKGQLITLKIILKNTGEGTAKDISCQFGLEPMVTDISKMEQNPGNLAPGDTLHVYFKFLVKEGFKEKETSIRLNLEQQNALAINKEYKLVFSKEKKQKYLARQYSDVDVDIPSTTIKRKNMYALVIGNENYSLSNNPNVEFAKRDAEIFKEYLIRMFGIPEDNILFGTDLTKGLMDELIKRTKNLVDSSKELIVYYAGHGLPDESNQPYLVPVDVSNLTLKESGISHYELIKELSENKPKRITMFLDACFSGGSRNGSLLSQTRSIRIKPKNIEISGNTIIFSATSADEYAQSYKEQSHGLFTYCLLKKIKESGTSIRLQELSQQISSEVKEISAKKGVSIQNPEVNVSPAVMDMWKNMQLIEMK